MWRGEDANLDSVDGQSAHCRLNLNMIVTPTLKHPQHCYSSALQCYNKLFLLETQEKTLQNLTDHAGTKLLKIILSIWSLKCSRQKWLPMDSPHDCLLPKRSFLKKFLRITNLLHLSGISFCHLLEDRRDQLLFS
mgnify:CR=1 FL=1